MLFRSKDSFIFKNVLKEDINIFISKFSILIGFFDFFFVIFYKIVLFFIKEVMIR